MSLAGIDVGTSGCKVAAYSLDGKLLGLARRDYEMLRPEDGWAELDPNTVAEATRSALSEVASYCSHDPVSALSVSSMGEAMVPVSADGEILGNAILMVDSRGGHYAEELERRVGSDRFYHINPNIISPNYSYPKLAWLRDNEPQKYANTECFLLMGDFVLSLLGGDWVTSYSLANRTLLFDIHRQGWSSELLDAAGIDGGKLPEPVLSGTPCGTMSSEIAEELGLAARPLLVVGAHDQCCNSLGSGITRKGKASCGIGTVECIAPTYDHIPDEATMKKAGLNIEHHALPGLYTSFIYNQAGSLISWYREILSHGHAAVTSDDELLATLNREMPDEPTPLLVLPYFEMTGAPTFKEGGYGAIVGLKTSTTRGEIFKALMECETFYFVESLQTLTALGVDTSEFIATGGGARSDNWLQIKADIFGVPYIRPQITEGGTLGAAILAGLADGSLASAQDGIDLFVKTDQVFYPDNHRHEVYREKGARYRELYPAVKGILS